MHRITTGSWTRETRGLWTAALVFGAVSNLLLLTGPLFMLQVYDRVLTGRSVPTLLVLFALVAFVYAMMAVIDTARARVMARIGAQARFQMEERVFDASLRARLRAPPDPRAASALRDLDAVQRALGSPAAQALLDLPWSLAFLVLLAFLHPLLGWLALGGGSVLVVLALLGQLGQRGALHDSAQASAAADRLQAAAEGVESGAVASPGLRAAWRVQRVQAMSALLRVSDLAARGQSFARSFRMFLQSATLALGAWLVLNGAMSPGLMIGASILLGRALAPVEQLSAQWTGTQAAWRGWRRLDAFLRASGAAPPDFAPPQPGTLTVRNLVVTGTGRAAPLLRLPGFDLQPGRALGVIGPGGAGKSLLCAVLVGVVPPSAGALRLGDTPLTRLTPRFIGHLPQRFALPPGTLAEVIARHDPAADPDGIVAAARLAGAHAAIASLPDGYGTRSETDGLALPGGLVQRIGLARAFHGNPLLVILDEPNAHLDAEGSATLNGAIRALKLRGVAVVVTAHRPAAIAECEDLLVLDAGAQAGLGPRDPVMRDLVRNHMDVVRAAGGAR